MVNRDSYGERTRKAVARLYTTDLASREEAIQELVAIGAPAIPKLLYHMRVTNENDVLRVMRILNVERRIPVAEQIKDDIVEALVGIGEPAIQLVLDELVKQQSSRKRAAMVLNRIGPPAVDSLVKLLEHKDTSIRDAAVQALSGIETEAASSALHDALRSAIIAGKKAKRDRLFAYAAIPVYFGLLSAIYHLFHIESSFFLPLTYGGGFLSASRAFDATRSRRNTLQGLQKTATPQMMGAFAACLDDSDKEVRLAAAEALKQLLPRVQASDRQYISPAEMDTLLKHLEDQDYRLTLSILKALEQIGDEKALPKVEHIAEAKSGYLADVVIAAQECLPFLRLRAEQSRQANTLLRASEAATAPEMLLRPAAEASSEPTQLLRPNA